MEGVSDGINTLQLIRILLMWPELADSNTECHDGKHAEGKRSSNDTCCECFDGCVNTESEEEIDRRSTKPIAPPPLHSSFRTSGLIGHKPHLKLRLDPGLLGICVKMRGEGGNGRPVRTVATARPCEAPDRNELKYIGPRGRPSTIATTICADPTSKTLPWTTYWILSLNRGGNSRTD